MTVQIPAAKEPNEYDTIVSYSELDTYRQCPLKHQLAYVDRWTRPNREGGALAKGTLWHSVLEQHYLVIKEVQEVDVRGWTDWVYAEGNEDNLLHACWQRVEPLLYDENGEQTEDQELIEWMYLGHTSRYGVDPQWIILGVESKLTEYLPAPEGFDPHGHYRFLLKAKLDLIVQDARTGEIWVVDHKSGAELLSDQAIEIDDQFGLYCWLMRQSGLPVAGAIHDGARAKQLTGDKNGKKPTELDKRFRRTYMVRSDIELDHIARDAWAAAANAHRSLFASPLSMALPLYSSPNPKECGWKCDFKESHIMARKGRELDEVLDEQGFVQNFERH